MVVALRYSKSKEEAEDILQESFVKVFKQICRFKGKFSLSTWITRVVINTALKYSKDSRKNIEFPQSLIMDRKDDPELPGKIHFEELIALIQRLPSGARMVFNLYAIEG